MRTAQALRRGGGRSAITVIGEEPHHPYDRPPLSKQMLGLGDGVAAVPLVTPGELDELEVDLRTGIRAEALDAQRRVVHTSDGAEVPYEKLVIATGAIPRALTFPVPRGVHTLRTLDDASILREALHRRPRVVVIGAGFIGAEFASAARAAGCGVVIVEAQPVPMAHLLGPVVGDALAGLHRSRGVELHTGASVTQIRADDAGAVSSVLLSDGRSLPADLVVVGIGAQPATEWLVGSGVPLRDGVVCDDRLRVLGVPHVHAAGDIARWPHPLYEGTQRIEHWTNAQEHAAVVAADLLGTPVPAPQIPYVWSDQYGQRIQIAGRPAAGELARLEGDVQAGLVALYADSAGVAVGAVVVDDPRGFMRIRRALLARSQASAIEVPARAAGPA